MERIWPVSDCYVDRIGKLKYIALNESSFKGKCHHSSGIAENPYFSLYFVTVHDFGVHSSDTLILSFSQNNRKEFLKLQR